MQAQGYMKQLQLSNIVYCSESLIVSKNPFSLICDMKESLSCPQESL